MAQFTGPCINEQIGHQRWKVFQTFDFISDTGLVVSVEAGFEHDFASIPAIVQGLISKVGYWSQGAIVHDLLYYRHRTGLDDRITRLQADNLLLEGLRIKADEFNVPDVERRDWLIYGGVRIGGLNSWLTQEEKKQNLPDYYDQ